MTIFTVYLHSGVKIFFVLITFMILQVRHLRITFAVRPAIFLIVTYFVLFRGLPVPVEKLFQPSSVHNASRLFEVQLNGKLFYRIMNISDLGDLSPTSSCSSFLGWYFF